MNDAINCDEFLLGQLDCKQGKPHREGMSESYNRGYAAQYAFEQVQDEMVANYE